MLVKHHFNGIQCHQVLTSLTEKELGVFSCFGEFQKTAEKKTLGVSFFVKFCLSSPKKYKTMLKRTA